MNILETYVITWKKTFDYKTRATRKEYWTFTLLNWAIFIALLLLTIPISWLTSSPSYENTTLTTIGGFLIAAIIVNSIIFAFAIILPGIAVAIRRLHDIDFNGWWFLIIFAPFGGIVFFIFTLLDGTPGNNRFGANPKNRHPKKSQPQTGNNGD